MSQVLVKKESGTGKEKLATMKRIVIGLCGGTGSGKTTLAKRIYEAFKDDALLIGMDSYYKDYAEYPFEERVKVNYDHPSSFDTDLLIKDLAALKRGETVMLPAYDFTHFCRAKESIRTESKRVIIVEGILLFENKELVDGLDIKIFVDTDADVRILRRIMRDVKERGRSLDSVVNQYLTTVKPMHETFIEPSKREADVIVSEGGHNEVAFDMIFSTILKKINE